MEPAVASVVLHGHFYQPPREDPWTGRIPPQPDAAPHENWNVRIAEECYAPLARLGVFDWMSFDIGPTLADWLERRRPEVHDAVRAGDRAGLERTGHGNALAQPYHHVILPLASERDKRLEVRWGLDDFERRFGRRAEGMWLPETAVDHPTLQVLARAGVAFTVLAPHQVGSVPRSRLGRVSLGDGLEIAVFVYDGALSHGVAFGELLKNPRAWVARIERAAEGGEELVAIATDGETFGHHHRGADRRLATVIRALRSRTDLRLENFASRLAAATELEEVTLIEPTSWSCAHGIERWRSDCGCKMAPEKTSQQAWRAPLREALEWLAGELDDHFRAWAPGWLSDPDGARRGLGRVLGGGAAEMARYAQAAAAPRDGAAAHARILLDLARDASAMFTSCGWFFDDVGGLEAEQVLRYAAHAVDAVAALDPERARRLDEELARRLASAPSNDPEIGDAGRLYREGIRAAHPPLAEPRPAQGLEQG